MILRSGLLDEFHAVAVVDCQIVGEYGESWPVTNSFRHAETGEL